MKRYSIMVVQAGGHGEQEYLQVDNNPKEIASELASRTTRGRKHLPLYTSVRVRDNHEAQPEQAEAATTEVA